MKKKIIFIITAFCTILMSSIAMISADPSNPPPPPPTTSYTYVLMDQFKGCGPQDGEANYCEDYYLRQEVVSSQSGTSITETNVCGKDPRCDAGTACEIDNPNDNNAWKSIELEDEWKCPDGYGIAQIHQPSELDPQYDTLSFSGLSILPSETAFRSNNTLNMFFNSYIPACVNRIPMMNFNAYLQNSTEGEQSNKVGLYALHETLDYDSSPTGGQLRNFDIPQQEKFRKVYDMKGDLRTYRMWSFRERFTEGLIRTVNQENLQLPENIDVDSLDSGKSHDFEEIYFSRDYMLGSFDVDNLGGYPVGTDTTQQNSLKCNIDVNDLGVGGINDNDDFEDRHDINSYQNQIISSIENDGLCDGFGYESSMDINSVDFVQKLSSIDPQYYTDSIRINDISDIGLSSRYDNVYEFENWASSNYVYLSTRLRNEGILDNDESISSITGYDRDTNTNERLNLDPDDFSQSNASELHDYVNGLSSSNYESFSKELEDEGYIDDMYVMYQIDDVSIDGDEVELRADFFTHEVELDVQVIESQDYYGFVEVELNVEYEVSTASSWSWRSLEDLTLTLLARCLYNWDECLYNEREEPGVPWTMNEVADLGYGPDMNTVAYQWSAQELMKDFGLSFGFHFDGARGFDSNSIPITVYRSCETGDNWISKEGYYNCYEGDVYKCEFALSADETELGVIPVSIGNTIDTGGGTGFVCHNANVSGVLEPRWSPVTCPAP